MRVSGDHWVDAEGRRLVLRGANLGGDCKVPVRPDGDTRLKEGFYDGRNVSFVGRPFPLDEAASHFERLKRWGFDFHRLLVTWEAVEHGGPGIYDEEYLDYLERIAAIAEERGVRLFIDPHQDAWSRWTGGDGAPIWTLEAAGFEPSRLFASGAAHLNQELGSAYPQMSWVSNFDRLACATMWTLFFGGDSFAPGIGPIGFDPGASGPPSLQAFLQSRYIEAMATIARRLSRFENVVGFDSLNEPHMGYIGVDSLLRTVSMTSIGISPSPWQGILAGSGHPVEVPIYGIRAFSRAKVGTAQLGAEGARAWKEGVDCIWSRAGLWSEGGLGGRPELRLPGHFGSLGGRKVDPISGFLKPFIERFDRTVCRAGERRRLVLFVEGVPNAGRPSWTKAEIEGAAGSATGAAGGGFVDATHWYDDLTLVTKRWFGMAAFDARAWKPVLGVRNVRRYFIRALAELKAWGETAMAGSPSLLGEFGLPFDLNRRSAYRNGDYRVHVRALSAYYDAIDANLLDSTIWNYTAANRLERGDLWNTEDLSIFCRDYLESGRSETGEAEDTGGRALAGFVRPYARAVAGELLEMRFDRRRGTFLLRYKPDPSIPAPTLVFVPELQFPRGFSIEAEGCEAEVARGELRLSAIPGALEARVLLRRR
jgi:hypothetical protein